MSNISTRVAITGANSFVGKNVRKFLYKKKVSVLGISRKNFSKYSTETKIQSRNLLEQRLQKKLKSHDALVHLIGIGKETQKATFEEVNIQLTNNCWRSLRSLGQKHMGSLASLVILAHVFVPQSWAL